jgi:hypothetical protein
MDVVEIAIVGVGTVVVQPDGHGQLLVRGRQTPFRIDPRQPGETVWHVVERVGERLRRMAELCGGR